MAYLTIIAQTFGFEDSYGYFTAALINSAKRRMLYDIDGVKFKKHRFDRVVITNKGDVLFLPPVIKHYQNKNLYYIDQWMGAGKSVIGMEHLGRVHARGGTIMANMAIGYMPHNIGLPKEKWTPNIQSLEDLKSANNCTILIDDFKKIVQRWQCSEAVFIGMVANESRKDKKDILITAQRVVNFIPKDIREVCTNYEIPYITVRDQRIESDDGMGMPIEIEVFNVSATGSFLGFGIWNGFFPDGKTLKPTKKMLDMYNTREVVTDLKSEEGTQPGNESEENALEYLKEKVPSMAWKRTKKGKGVQPFDIIGEIHAIDVCGVDDGCRLITDHKSWGTHRRNSRRIGRKPYLMFWFEGDWAFIVINDSLPCGERIPIDSIYNRIRRLESLLHTKPR